MWIPNLQFLEMHNVGKESCIEYINTDHCVESFNNIID